MANKTVYGFSQNNADQLLGLIRKTGGENPSNSADTRQHALVAVATTGVTARAGTTLGSGTVAVKALGYSGANVVISDAGYTLDVYNLAGTAVATGAYILIHQYNTFWIVIWEECD